MSYGDAAPEMDHGDSLAGDHAVPGGPALDYAVPARAEDDLGAVLLEILADGYVAALLAARAQQRALGRLEGAARRCEEREDA